MILFLLLFLPASIFRAIGGCPSPCLIPWPPKERGKRRPCPLGLPQHFGFSVGRCPGGFLAPGGPGTARVPVPLSRGGLSQQPVGGPRAKGGRGPAGRGIGIHWHIREWGVGAGVRPAGAGGGSWTGWARLLLPSFLRLWGPCWLQQESAPIVCNERGSGISPGTHNPAPCDPCHASLPRAPQSPGSFAT